MNKGKYVALIVIGIIGLSILFSFAYIVKETEQVIITQFGKPVRKPITTPGIHFKIPYIQKAHFFDKRFLEWDGEPNQVPTGDKRFVKVDLYGRWRISDPLLFFQRVRDERGAQSRLDDILDGETRNAIAKYNIVEIIKSTNRSITNQLELDIEDNSEFFIKIEKGREYIAASIVEVANTKTLDLGIELLDLRFKRINYVREVEMKIFERMIAERKRIAEKFRSEGKGAQAKILGDKVRELKGIRSDAYRQAQEIIGKADADATKIYARAYNQSPASRDFYKFIKTMETYKTSLRKKDLLILSTDGDFFRYLRKKQ
ncbi:protease modulator HflC [Spirochaetota bacterium]